MRSKLSTLLFFLSASKAALALPLVESAAAGAGVWEAAMLMVAVFGAGRAGVSWRRWGERKRMMNVLVPAFLTLLGLWSMSPSSSDLRYRPDMKNYPGMLYEESQRKTDKRAISAEKAQEILRQGTDIFDVRSSLETEQGTATGFKRKRLSDLMEGGVKGRHFVLTCRTGMRGSEACGRIEKAGGSCNYITGGLEEWENKKLPMTFPKGFRPADFGSGEWFEGADEKLSAKTLASLESKGDILLIDARRNAAVEGEPALGAYRMSVDEMTTEELDSTIGALPEGTSVVVACSGDVNCSEAPSVGWEFAKRGMRYLGSYSEGPEALEAQRGAFVKRWFEKRTEGWSTVEKAAACIISMGLALAILLAGMIPLRKARKERRKVEARARRQRREQEVLREGLKDLVRSKPWVLVAWMVCIPGIMGIWASASIGATLDLSREWQVAGAFVSALIISLRLSSTLSYPAALFSGGGAGLFLYANSTGWVTSGAGLIIGSLLVLSKILLWKKAKAPEPGMGKAGALAMAAEWGLPVPRTMVTNREMIKNVGDVSAVLIKRFVAGGSGLAVRSSAADEDGGKSSMAGLYSSEVPVKGDWREAVKRVSSEYGSASGEVIIQRVVEARWSGAAFSLSPLTAGNSIVEWGDGFSGERMSGEENSKCSEWRRGKEPESIENGPNLKRISQLLADAEDMLGVWVDMEWVEDGSGKVWVVQTRPQTGLSRNSLAEEDEDRLVPVGCSRCAEERVSETGRCLNGLTRISAALVERTWETGGAAHKAALRAGWGWERPYMEGPALKSIDGLLIEDGSVSLRKPTRKEFEKALGSARREADAFNEDLNTVALRSGARSHVRFDELSRDEWRVTWMDSLETWERIQEHAMYFEFMAVMAAEKDGVTNGSWKPISWKGRGWRDEELSEPRSGESDGPSQEDLKAAFGVGDGSMPKVDDVGGFQALREMARDAANRALAPIRAMILEAGSRSGLGNSVFAASPEEIESIAFGDFPKERERMLSASIKRLAEGRGERSIIQETALFGKWVSGAGPKSGKALRLDLIEAEKRLETIERLGSKRLIFCDHAEPRWIASAKRAGAEALICQNGSVLSHPAVLAREMGLPMFVGCPKSDFPENGSFSDKI